MSDVLNGIDLEDEAARARLHRELLLGMYILVKNGLLFDENNPTLHDSCDRVTAIANALLEIDDGAAAIQFLADGVYVNRQLVKLDSNTYPRGEYLFTIWKAFGVGEIAAMSETSRSDWLELIGALTQCIRTNAGEDALRDRILTNLRLSPLDEVTHGEHSGSGERIRAVRAYSVAYLIVGELLDNAHTRRPARVVALKRALQELISVAPRCQDLLLGLVHLKRHKASIAHHLVNTAVLVICISVSLELERGELTELALRACLHDIGIAFQSGDVPEDPFEADATRSLESVCCVIRISSAPHKNPGRVVTANEMYLWANSDPEAKYPYSASSATRLIAVAHAYDALTTPTRSRPALLPDEAVRVIMAEAGRRYDDTVVRLLIDLVGVYPVGSAVGLSTGEVAIVLKAGGSEQSWATPLIRIVRDSEGRLIDGPILDLARDTRTGRQIIGSIDAEHAGVNTPAYLMT
jgi:hypothetical protein